MKELRDQERNFQQNLRQKAADRKIDQVQREYGNVSDKFLASQYPKESPGDLLKKLTMRAKPGNQRSS